MKLEPEIKSEILNLLSAQGQLTATQIQKSLSVTMNKGALYLYLMDLLNERSLTRTAAAAVSPNGRGRGFVYSLAVEQGKGGAK